MTRAKRPIISLIITLFSLLCTALVIYLVPPSNWLVEVAMLLLLLITLILGSAWLLGNTKRGLQVALAIVGLIIMQRFRILNLPTIGLWLIVVGLISLIN